MQLQLQDKHIQSIMSIKDFQVLAKLGEGAYSSVYKVKRLVDDQAYALKRVKLGNLSDKQKQNALNEVRILASVRHPNIVGYKQAFLDQSSNSLCIVMEFADNGDLYQKITEHQKKSQFFTQAEIWTVFIQVVKGLKALHDLKILHRDLKVLKSCLQSANVFLTSENIAKLGDMNVSKVAKRGLCQTQTGTPYYASPEVWKDQAYDSKSDIWSLGCVLYEMITLNPPFRAEDMQGLYKKVIKGSYSKIPSQFSQDLSSVIKALLQTDPNQRPSCDAILQMQAVVKRLDENTLIQPDEAAPELLKTIRIPKNIHILTQKLPKPNYIPIKYRRSTISSIKSLQKQVDPKHYHNSSLEGLPSIIRKNRSNQQVLEKLLRKEKKKKRQNAAGEQKLELEVSGKHMDRMKNNPYEDGGLVLPRIHQGQEYQNNKIREIRDVYQANSRARRPKAQ